MFRLYYIVTYPITLLFLLLIWLYRLFIRHAMGRSCQFQPTCSHYALESIREFGWLLGGVLAFKRIIRCRPNGDNGYDLLKLNLSGNYKWKC